MSRKVSSLTDPFTLHTLIRFFRHYSKTEPKSISAKLSERHYQITKQSKENYYFWTKSINNEKNKYALGIKPAFIKDFGSPAYIDISCELGAILDKGDEFGQLENAKTTYSITSPFNNAKLCHYNSNIDLNRLSKEPDNIENKLCVFIDTKASTH